MGGRVGKSRAEKNTMVPDASDRSGSSESHAISPFFFHASDFFKCFQKNDLEHFFRILIFGFSISTTLHTGGKRCFSKSQDPNGIQVVVFFFLENHPWISRLHFMSQGSLNWDPIFGGDQS